MVVSSGRGRHAYWVVSPPATPDVLERANRRLAYRLGGDMRSTDAARVLRPPGSINRKNHALVGLLEATAEVFELDYVTGDLPDPPGSQPLQASREPRTNGDDPLLSIPPVVYVEELLGVKVGFDRKVPCPFPGHRNADRTPSLHVYDDPADGWYCYGCGRGGSIYDLAGALAGYELRGMHFVAIAGYLRERFA